MHNIVPLGLKLLHHGKGNISDSSSSSSSGDDSSDLQEKVLKLKDHLKQKKK